MVLYSNKIVNRLRTVLQRLSFARINIRKIRPTIFTVVGLIIYDKIIPKRWAIIFMHTYRKFCLKRSEFSIFQIFWRRNEKTMLVLILLIDPLIRWLPSKWAKSYDNLIVFGFGSHDGICNSITFLMENLCWKIVLSGSVKQVYIINLFLHHVL